MRRSSKIVKLGRHFTSQQSRRLASTSEITHGGSKSFWAQVAVEDLPETNVDLELYRRHNSSFPYIEKQLVVGKIVSVERNHVAIDTGLKTLTSFAKKELHLSQLVRSRDATVRNSAQDFRVGDVMHFVLEELETPFGDVGLRVNKVTDGERAGALWDELQERFDNKKPVMGRVLNAVNGGYAVGIAGLVVFMPFSLCSLLTASKVGLLQPFLIQRLDREIGNMVVSDPLMVEQQEARRIRDMEASASYYAAKKLERERRRQSESKSEDRRPNFRMRGGNRTPGLAFITAILKKAIDNATEPEAAVLRSALTVIEASAREQLFMSGPAVMRLLARLEPELPPELYRQLTNPGRGPAPRRPETPMWSQRPAVQRSTGPGTPPAQQRTAEAAAGRGRSAPESVSGRQTAAGSGRPVQLRRGGASDGSQSFAAERVPPSADDPAPSGEALPVHLRGGVDNRNVGASRPIQKG